MKQKENIVSKIELAAGIMLCALIASGFILKVQSVLGMDLSREYREMTAVEFARLIAGGVNPYGLEMLDREVLLPTNIYGLLAPYLMSIFVKLFHYGLGILSVLQSCQLMTVIVELIGCVFFYLAVRERTGRHIYAAIGTYFYYGCFWRYSAFSGAFADSFGLALLPVLFFLVYRDQKREKPRLFMYAVLLILLFYAKQYFILVSVGLFFFVWSAYSLKKAFILAFESLGVMLGSIAVIQLACPLYFTESLAIAQSQNGGGDYLYSISQLPFLLIRTYGIFTCLVGLALIMFIFGKKLGAKENFSDLVRVENKHLTVSYELCELIFTFPMAVYIAQEKGALYSYYLQIFIPFFILTGIVAANSIFSYVKNKMTNVVAARGLLICSIGLCLLFTYGYRSFIFVKSQTEEEIAVWKEVNELIEQYDEAGEVFLAPVPARYYVEHDIPFWDYGQGEYNTPEFYENYQNNSFMKTVFPYADVIFQKYMANDADFYDKLSEGYYHCVIVDDFREFQADFAQGMFPAYSLYGDRVLKVGNEEIVIHIYLKKES